MSRLVLAEKKRQKLRRQKASSPGTSSVPSPSNESAPYTRLTPSQLPTIPVSPMAAGSISDEDLRSSLKGLSIVIIHVKMALFPSYCATTTNPDSTPSPGSTNSFTTAENEESVSSGKGVSDEKEKQQQQPGHHAFNERLIDPRTMQERILEELNEVESESELGVQFVMAKQGMKIEC